MNHTLKIIIFIFAIIAIITVSGLITHKALYSSSVDLENKLTSIENYTLSSDWVNADKTLKKVSEKWMSVKKTWSVLIDHQEIDNIDITLTRMEKFIQCKDTPSALAEAAALIKYVKHIPRKEVPGIENIL